MFLKILNLFLTEEKSIYILYDIFILEVHYSFNYQSLGSLSVYQEKLAI